MNRQIFLYCLVALFLSSSAQAKTWKVSPEAAASLPETFESLKSGDTLVLKRGTYQFDRALKLRGLKNVTIEGRGRVSLILTNLNEDVIEVRDCQDITLKGLRAKHGTPAKRYQCEGAVIKVQNSSRVFIAKNELNGCGAAGVFVMSSRDVVIHKNKIFNNSFAGVWVQNGKVMVNRNKIFDNAAAFITYGKCHTTLTENEVRDNSGNNFAGGSFFNQVTGKN